MISIDSNMTANIVRKVINVQQEKCRTIKGSLRNSSINWIFLWRLFIQNHLKPSCSFKLVLEGKIGKEMSESSWLDFLEKFSANNFALSDAEESTYRLLNTGGIADLPLLRTLLAICQKLRESSFWELMDSFVLLACASLAASRTILQRLLACLNFTYDQKDCLNPNKNSHNYAMKWGILLGIWWKVNGNLANNTIMNFLMERKSL